MLFTVPGTQQNQRDYLLNYAAPYMRYGWALGTDQYFRANHVNDELKNRGFCYAYGFGTTVLVDGFAGYYIDRVAEAIILRDGGNSFKLVYAWTIYLPGVMAEFLTIGVDGIITPLTNTLHDLVTSWPFNTKYSIANKEDNPFTCSPFAAQSENPNSYGPPDFKVKTYHFVDCEMFVAVNNNYGSTLLKIKCEGGTGHDMFDIGAVGNRDFENLQQHDWLLGTQLFNTFIVDIVYDGNNILVAFTDGKVVKVRGTGGGGHNMFALVERINEFESVQNYDYLIGYAKFQNRISCMKYIYDDVNNYLFIGTYDGKLLKIKRTGGGGRNMFAVNETVGVYTNVDQNLYDYYVGDNKFLGFVAGMEYISGFTFVWFNNHRVLKINGTGGTHHNMFAIYENTSVLMSSGGNYYVGDDWFLGEIRCMKLINSNLYIGFSNGKILQEHGTGGGGHGMFAVQESNSDFSTDTGYGHYAGDQFFPGGSIESIQYYQGYIMVGIKYGIIGLVLKINGYGGNGHNMFAINLQSSNNAISVSPADNLGYYAGEASLLAGVTGLNLINNSLFVEFANGLLLKIKNVGGTDHNMFAIIPYANIIDPYQQQTYDYYQGDQYFGQ